MSSGDDLQDLLWLLKEWKNCIVKSEEDIDLGSVEVALTNYNLEQAKKLITRLKARGDLHNLD